MEVDDSPFANAVPKAPARPHWVRPELSCEVRFAERTDDGRLRAPVFHGLVETAVPDVPSGPLSQAGGDRTVEEGSRRVTLTNLDKLVLAARGHHQGQPARPLPAHRAGAGAAPGGAPDDPQALPQRHRRGLLLPAHGQRRARLDRAGRPLAQRPARARRLSHYVLIDDPLALLWVVNLGCIDLNPWQSRAAAPDEPTHVLFDLDPADDLPFARVVEAALLVRDALETVGLRGYPRTSGASGMHILVPLVPGLSFDAVRLFARVVSEALVGARPDLVTTRDQDRRPRARACTSTPTRTAAARASPASTRCARARARRWRPRCAGTRCARGSIRAPVHHGRGRAARRERGRSRDRPAGGSRRPSTTPSRGSARGPRERRAGRSAPWRSRRSRPSRRGARAPAGRWPPPSPEPPPTGTGYFVGSGSGGIGGSLDLHGEDPVVRGDRPRADRPGRPGGRGAERRRSPRWSTRARSRSWPPVRRGARPTTTAPSRSSPRRTRCTPATAPPPAGRCACWRGCPTRVPPGGAATFYVVLRGVTAGGGRAR